jgi:tetratricopeptide (TPR) repeat protein
MRIFVAMLLVVFACSGKKEATDNPVVLTGLDGKNYLFPELSESAKARLDSNLQVAEANFEQNPTEENYIWLGRRLAYQYRYKEAIDVFTEGLEKFPNSYKLLRHRGHRYITLRDLGKAVADLQMAASLMPKVPLETEPDGIPNKLNQPLSTTQFNVWYHLGLAHYLKGDFANAEKAYVQCLEVSTNDDLITATVDWLYMTYRRLNQTENAQRVLALIKPDMNIIENDSYYLRLKMYRGEVPPDSVLNVTTIQEDMDLALATQGYGVGNWYLYNSDTTRARAIFEKVCAGKHFSSFGFIAAEAELVRLKK